MDPGGGIRLRLIILIKQSKKSIVLKLLDILMQFDHLIVQLLYSDILIEVDSLGQCGRLFLFCLLCLILSLILEIYVAVLYEILSEFAHTFCVF